MEEQASNDSHPTPRTSFMHVQREAGVVTAVLLGAVTSVSRRPSPAQIVASPHHAWTGLENGPLRALQSSDLGSRTV